MHATRSPLILASRSPQRLDLLSSLVPIEALRVLPPTSHIEEEFDGLRTLSAIEKRAAAIAAAKCDDVLRQLRDDASKSVVIAADTVVIVGNGNELLTLGQPPEPGWRDAVRGWFANYYDGRMHRVLTALCVATPAARYEKVVTTQVTFRDDVASYVDWYLETEEPRGKAGGYAIQGAGSLFVDRVEGSLTNVIGLPLRELLDILRAAEAL